MTGVFPNSADRKVMRDFAVNAAGRKSVVPKTWNTFATAALQVLIALGMSGCVGPKAVQYTRMRYNEVIRATNDEQLLTNIVRLRYADSPVFIDLPNITSQFEISGRGNYLGGYGNQDASHANLGFGELAMRDTPTLSYHPREGREIAKSLLTPISADLFSVVNAGANIEQLLLMTVNDINDIPNAPRATQLYPRVPDDNARFLRVVRLLAELRDRDATEMGFVTREDRKSAGDPIAANQVAGRDLLAAAKDGYVYRARGDGKLNLYKRDREFTLRIRPPHERSPAMKELSASLGLIPGRSAYRVDSELADEGGTEPPDPLGSDTIYLNMRSVIQIMTFLSKGVCVPEEHLVTGMVPTTLDSAGMPFDWTRVTAGNFSVKAQKHRPKRAEVAIKYRGYWFYVAENDVSSRSILAILEVLFALQESDAKPAGPLLTLPLGG